MPSDRRHQILDIIRRDPLITQHDLAVQLGISRSAVAGHIMMLTRSGEIAGRGYILNAPHYVCVLGGANVDVEGRSHGPLVRGDSNPGAVHRSPGGVGRNIAENLVRLDVPTRLITAFGRDHDGRWLHDETSAAGVDLTDCLWASSAGTATYLSIVDDTGEMSVALNDMSALEELDVAAIEARHDCIANSAAVVLDCNLGPAALARVVAAAGDRPLFVDTVSNTKALRIAEHLSAVHTLKPNRAEAALLSGVDITGRRSLRAAAAALLDQGVQRVVMSLGADGVFFADAAGAGYVAPPPVEIASVTGAGDALMAALVHAQLHELPLEDAARFGVAAAGITASSPRTVAEDLSPASVSELLERHAS